MVTFQRKKKLFDFVIFNKLHVFSYTLIFICPMTSIFSGTSKAASQYKWTFILVRLSIVYSICIYYCQKEKSDIPIYSFVLLQTIKIKSKIDNGIDVPDKLTTRMCNPTNYATCNVECLHDPVLPQVLHVPTDHQNNYPAYNLDTASFVNPSNSSLHGVQYFFSFAHVHTAVYVCSLVFYLITNNSKHAQMGYVTVHFLMGLT